MIRRFSQIAYLDGPHINAFCRIIHVNGGEFNGMDIDHALESYTVVSPLEKYYRCCKSMGHMHMRPEYVNELVGYFIANSGEASNKFTANMDDLFCLDHLLGCSIGRLIYLKYDYEDIDNDLSGAAGEQADYEQKLSTITDAENKVSLVENWEYKTIEYKQFIEDEAYRHQTLTDIGLSNNLSQLEVDSIVAEYNDEFIADFVQSMFIDSDLPEVLEKKCDGSGYKTYEGMRVPCDGCPNCQN